LAFWVFFFLGSMLSSYGLIGEFLMKVLITRFAAHYFSQVDGLARPISSSWHLLSFLL